MSDKTPDPTIRVGERNVSLEDVRELIAQGLDDVDGDIYPEASVLINALCREARRAVALEAGIATWKHKTQDAQRGELPLYQRGLLDAVKWLDSQITMDTGHEPMPKEE